MERSEEATQQARELAAEAEQLQVQRRQALHAYPVTSGAAHNII